MYQQSISKELSFTAPDLIGGNYVSINVKPAPPNAGIIFKGETGSVSANIENTFTEWKTIGLQDGDFRVVLVEHPLATLYGYGIDNVEIEIKKSPSRIFSMQRYFGLATKSEVMPTPEDRELTLCNLLDERGVIVSQEEERRLFTIEQPYEAPGWHFEPRKGSGNFELEAITNYSNYPGVGEQRHSMIITPENYEEIANSRPCGFYYPEILEPIVSIGAALWNMRYGLGHNLRREEFFIPPFPYGEKNAERWFAEEKTPNELAKHTIIDKLGAFALLPFRIVDVYARTKISNHANDLNVLKEMLDKSIFVPLNK